MDQGGLDRAAVSRATMTSWLVGAVFVLCFLMLAPSAGAEGGMLPNTIAPGSLDRPIGGLPQTGQPFSRAKWKVQTGDSITGTIVGATDPNLEGETQADVVIKSS